LVIGTTSSVRVEKIKQGHVFSFTLSHVDGAVGKHSRIVSSVVTAYHNIAALGLFFAIVAAADARCPPAENPNTAILSS